MQAYYLYFAKIYAGLLFLLICTLFLGLSLVPLSLLPILIVAGLITAQRFGKQQHRQPTNHEKIQLVWGLSAVAICIGSLFVFFLVMLNPNAEQILKQVDQAGLGLYALVMLCIVALHGAVFHLIFGWYIRYFVSKLP
jgi:hypothetical protein